MPVILPLLTVTRTWTSPHRVAMASPVAVPDAAAGVAVAVALAVAPGVAVAAGVAVALVATVLAAWVAGAWAWKARMPAVPASVADRTMGDRRMRVSVSEGEGLEVDAVLGHAGPLERG